MMGWRIQSGKSNYLQGFIGFFNIKKNTVDILVYIKSFLTVHIFEGFSGKRVPLYALLYHCLNFTKYPDFNKIPLVYLKSIDTLRNGST